MITVKVKDLKPGLKVLWIDYKTKKVVSDTVLSTQLKSPAKKSIRLINFGLTYKFNKFFYDSPQARTRLLIESKKVHDHTDEDL